MICSLGGFHFERPFLSRVFVSVCLASASLRFHRTHDAHEWLINTLYRFIKKEFLFFSFHPLLLNPTFFKTRRPQPLLFPMASVNHQSFLSNHPLSHDADAYQLIPPALPVVLWLGWCFAAMTTPTPTMTMTMVVRMMMGMDPPGRYSSRRGKPRTPDLQIGVVSSLTEHAWSD